MAFDVGTARRKKKFRSPSSIPINEWKKRFAMLPNQVVKKTLKNSTCFYLNIDAENRQDPMRQYKYHFLQICNPRQREVVASDMFFPSTNQTNGKYTPCNLKAIMCQPYRIIAETTEPHSLWQNPAESKIGQLNSM
eukprot:12399933-Ditylum_brightwellii.AAC.1